jgi:broad specificity phosphatase PhoE
MGSVSLLYVARHGETAWNAEGRLQGATDIPLNEIGREQAAGLAALMRGRGVRAVASSTLSRARETGTIVAAALEVPFVYEDDDLRERRFGIFEGLTRAQCDELDAASFRAWLADPHNAPPGAEDYGALGERVLRGLARAAQRLGDGGLVVTHGQALRAVLRRVLGEAVAPVPNVATYAFEVHGALLKAPRRITSD